MRRHLLITTVGVRQVGNPNVIRPRRQQRLHVPVRDLHRVARLRHGHFDARRRNELTFAREFDRRTAARILRRVKPDDRVLLYIDEGLVYQAKLLRGRGRYVHVRHEIIERNAEHWRMDRMAAVDRNVLRCGVAEFVGFPQTPKPVVINEALEIARRFSTPESVTFINGVLDSVAKELDGAKG